VKYKKRKSKNEKGEDTEKNDPIAKTEGKKKWKKKRNKKRSTKSTTEKKKRTLIREVQPKFNTVTTLLEFD